MTAQAVPAPRMARTWRVIREELAPSPGRLSATSRYVLASALVIVGCLSLEVPFLALTLIAVFFALQDNHVLSRKITIVGLLATTATVAASILLLKYTIDHPVWRILGASIIACLSVYLVRISRQLAPAGFLMALGVVYAQSLVDILSHGESLARFMLWVQVAGLHTTCIVFAILFLFPSAQPEYQLKIAWNQALDDVLRQLEALRRGRTPQLDLGTVEKGVTNRRRLFGFALQGRAFAREYGWHLARTTAVERLHLAAVHLSSAEGDWGDALEILFRTCERLKRDLAEGCAFRVDEALTGSLADSRALPAALHEMTEALKDLANAETRSFPPLAPPRRQLLVPDAFSNPAHLRFAVRTVLAAMACYIFYTAVDWPGIHTAMLTCIIMALPPLGPSSLGGVAHKGLVRMLGALLGSGLALSCTVFVLPHLNGITGLLAMVLPVIAGAAWITAGSARSNYVGRQIMFTFALALLGRFVLTPDIPEIRDRIVGILLGVGVYLALATVLWPDREEAALRRKLSGLLRSLAALARLKPGDSARDLRRAECWELLGQVRDLQTRVALEPGVKDESGLNLEQGLAAAQQTLGAIHWMQVEQGQAEPGTPRSETRREGFQAFAADWLEHQGEALERKSMTAPPVLSWPNFADEDPRVCIACGTVRDSIVQLGASLLPPPAPQPMEAS